MWKPWRPAGKAPGGPVTRAWIRTPGVGKLPSSSVSRTSPSIPEPRSPAIVARALCRSDAAPSEVLASRRTAAGSSAGLSPGPHASSNRSTPGAVTLVMSCMLSPSLARKLLHQSIGGLITYNDSSQLLAPSIPQSTWTAMRRNWPGVLVLLPIGISSLAAQQSPPGLDAYIPRVMQTFTVPGLSVAIVKDGKVMLAKGYGVRRMGDRAPADARTRFGIASNTKLFTATALALLVEEGKIEWEKPVIDYLPAFAMSDPYVTGELSVRDLLVHRSGLGLGAGSLLWWLPSTYDRKEIARRLRYIRPATSFRSAYAYDNVLYLIAAEVIETASGLSWEDFVRTRILARVGMSSSDARHPGATEVRSRNIAVTHAEVNDTVRVIAPFASDNTNPAGGIMSGAEDMARWVIVQLDSGRLGNGSRLYSPASARQLWRDVTPTGLGGAPPGFTHLRANFSGYALGLGVRDYRGVKLLQHTGGLPGYVSKVAMIPEHRLGVVVLTNQESGFAFESIIYHVLDHYL